jgi:hypothetical protein
VAYLLLKLILKNRYDSLIKLDFISKERLKTEINISNEKLALLMPKFILDRINYFEISSKRVFMKKTSSRTTQGQYR